MLVLSASQWVHTQQQGWHALVGTYCCRPTGSRKRGWCGASAPVAIFCIVCLTFLHCGALVQRLKESDATGVDFMPLGRERARGRDDLGGYVCRGLWVVAACVCVCVYVCVTRGRLVCAVTFLCA